MSGTPRNRGLAGPAAGVMVWMGFAMGCGDAERGADPTPETAADHCAIVGVVERQCQSGGGSTRVALDRCVPGAACERPEAYNVTREAIRCVDQYRFIRRVYPASCAEIAAYLDGAVECLVPWHCSSDEDDPGDWICTSDRSCTCPRGGRCPVPRPPPPPDAGVAHDAGPPDSGSGPPGPPDAG